MQMIRQLTQGQQQLEQALQESAAASHLVTKSADASNSQDGRGISGQNRSSIDVRDRSELRGIPRPDKFSGASGTWDSWYYKFKTWIESCHKNEVQAVQKLVDSGWPSQRGHLRMITLMRPSLFQHRPARL